MKLRSPKNIIDANPDNWIPHTYTRIDNCSVVFLKSLLNKIEEISLSTCALNTVVGKGSKDAKVNTLSDLIEFTTNWGRTEPITGDFRHIPTFAKFFGLCDKALGRRARDRRLPAKWSAFTGVYSLLEDNGGLRVRDNVSRIEQKVPKHERQVFSNGEVIPIEQLTIKKNFNANHAAIASIDSISKYIAIVSLGKFFSGEMPSHQRKMLSCGGRGSERAAATAAAAAAVPKLRVPKMITDADAPKAVSPEAAKDPYELPPDVHEAFTLPPLLDWLESGGGEKESASGMGGILDMGDVDLARSLGEVMTKCESSE